MNNKTTHEKEAEKITKAVLEVMELHFDASLLQRTDLLAMTSFKPLADVLRNKRIEMNDDFKSYCKANGLPQYKIKYIEDGNIGNIDLMVFAKHIRILNAENELTDWISKYPGIAQKYKINTIV